MISPATITPRSRTALENLLFFWLWCPDKSDVPGALALAGFHRLPRPLQLILRNGLLRSRISSRRDGGQTVHFVAQRHQAVELLIKLGKVILLPCHSVIVRELCRENLCDALKYCPSYSYALPENPNIGFDIFRYLLWRDCEYSAQQALH